MNPFSDKQLQIAERKTVGEQVPGDHGKEAAEQKVPGPQLVTRAVIRMHSTFLSLTCCAAHAC